MTLANRNAIIYGGGGSLGGAVAGALASAGARVFLTGRSLESVKAVAEKINRSGGRAEVAQVDALNETEVNAYLDNVVRSAGTIDISFCAIDYKDVQNMDLVDMSVDDFVRPVTLAMRSQFLTATSAARIMKKQGSGVILSLTATPGGIGYPYTGGFATACTAIETFSINLAAEVGAHGVRVVNIRSAGSPDSKVFKDAIENNPKETKIFLQNIENDTMLKQLPMMEDIANAAVFLCSDLARTITGVTIDVTSGTTSAFNYKVPRKK